MEMTEKIYKVRGFKGHGIRYPQVVLPVQWCKEKDVEVGDEVSISSRQIDGSLVITPVAGHIQRKKRSLTFDHYWQRVKGCMMPGLPLVCPYCGRVADETHWGKSTYLICDRCNLILTLRMNEPGEDVDVDKLRQAWNEFLKKIEQLEI